MQIIQILRRERAPVTAGRIADELEVTQRTVYRDVASLMANGVPVRGEAGVGYVLGDGFDLPPLMFTADELEAVILGARLVQVQGDSELAAAACDAVAKIGAVLPKTLRPILLDAPLIAPDYQESPPEAVDSSILRRALREQMKLKLDYVDQAGCETQRVVWPVALGYMDHKRMLIAHCELRDDFRHFRTDRIRDAEVLDDRMPARRAQLLDAWWKVAAEEQRAYLERKRGEIST